jgi:hypothetical protein
MLDIFFQVRRKYNWETEATTLFDYVICFWRVCLARLPNCWLKGSADLANLLQITM